MEFLKEIGISFVPILIAVDAIGVLPFILSLTQDMTGKERLLTVRNGMFTALILGLFFIVIGLGVFRLLGIEISDFLVAGGLILLILAIKHLVTGQLIEVHMGTKEEAIAVVPIGTPLLVGPAVLTTLLLLIEQYSIWAVLIAFLLNLFIAWIIFLQSNRVAHFLGRGGMKATSQIASLLLSAIAVKMIYQGIITLTNK